MKRQLPPARIMTLAAALLTLAIAPGVSGQNATPPANQPPPAAPPVAAPQSQTPVPSTPAAAVPPTDTPAPPKSDSSPQDKTTPAPAPEPTVQFNFKDTSYSDVIDFFSRAVGLPVIQRVEPPKGLLTYFSPEKYTLSEGLRILNIILQTKGVTLSREGQFLYLGTFDKTNPGPTFVKGTIPGSVTDDELITVLIPLEHVTAKDLCDHLKTLVGSYGGITPLTQQNAILLNETAGQVRRIQKIISAVDTAGDYQDQVQIYPVKYSKSDDLLSTLKVLMSEHVVKYVINQQGQQVKLEEDDLAGLRIQSDPRTNTIIAKGPTGRLTTLKEMISMLDVPGREGAGMDGEMTTFSLSRIDTGEASRLLSELYKGHKPADRPTIVPLPDLNQIALFGAGEAVQQAVALLTQADGGSKDNPDGFTRTTAIVPLHFAQPDVVQKALGALMNVRQSKLVQSVAAPDGKSIVIAGPSNDVAEVQKMVQALDVEPTGQLREVRLVRLAKDVNAKDLLQRTQDLYQKELGEHADEAAHRVEADLETGGNTITLIGQRDAVNRWQELFSSVQTALAVDRETRQIRLTNARPSQMVGALTALVRQVLTPANGAPFDAPTFVPVDQLDTLLVTARPDQFDRIQALATELDQSQPRNIQFRMISVNSEADANTLIARADSIYKDQMAANTQLTAVKSSFDKTTGSIMLVADDQAMGQYTSILSQLQQSFGPQKETRLFALDHIEAKKAAAFLTDLAANSQSFKEGGAASQQPAVDVIESTNSLLISAQPRQMQIIDSLIHQIDVVSTDDVPPVRIMQLETADAANLAQTLTQTYDARPAEQRRLEPVMVRADATTNTLLVSAHPKPFAEIQEIVNKLNESRKVSNTGREIRIFPLKVARAEDLAKTLDQMFPEAPVPVDRFGRPLYNLRQPREVVVRADPQTNSIIVDAPVERLVGFEELVKQLDATQVSADSELHTYTITHADLSAVKNTLSELAQSGSLFPKGKGSAGLGAQITVNVEPQTRTLIVSGPVGIFPEVEKVLAKMDARPDRPPTVMKFYRLQHAKAEKLVPILQNLLMTRMNEQFDAKTLDVKSLLEVTSERASNTLIISAPESIIPIAEELIRQLDDVTASADDPVIRIVPMTFADASTVAQTLNETVTSMISRSTHEPVNVRVIPSPGSNAIILIGPPTDLDDVAKLIEPLDARPGLDALVAQTFVLQNADATKVAEMVQRLLQDQQETDPRIRLAMLRASRGVPQEKPTIRVEPDPRTNSLIVSAPQQTLALASELIRQIDMPSRDASRKIEVFTPARAQPAQLVTLVGKLVNGAGAREVVDLTVAPQSNTIVIQSADDGKIKEALAFLKKFDDETPAMPVADLQLINVRNVDVNLMATVLTNVLRDQSRWPSDLRDVVQAGIPIAQPAIFADPAGSRVVISAPKQLMPLARQMITQFDQPRSDDTEIEFKVFNLTRASAPDVAKTIQVMLDTRAANHPGQSKPSVSAEASTNSIIVAVNSEDMDEVEKIIKPLDTGLAANEAQVRTIYLKHAQADRVAPIITQLLNGEQLADWLRVDILRRGQPLPDTGPDVRVASEPRLNAVVISAPGSILDVAEEIVRQLDVDPNQVAAQTGNLRSVRVIPLVNTDARQVAANLTAVFADEVKTNGAQAPSLQVDAESNSLIVRATPEQFDTIDKVVGSLEKATIVGSREIQMIPIDKSRLTALQAAQTIQRLLQQRSGTRVEIISVDELIRRNQTDSPTGPAAGSGSSSETPKPLAPEVDRGAGTPPSPADPELAGELISGRLRLLSAISAARLACIGDSWLKVSDDPPAATHSTPPAAKEDQPANSTPPAARAVEAPRQEPEAHPAQPQETAAVTIAVDEATNSLIVVGSPRMTRQLSELAQQIEKQIPPLPEQIHYVTLENNVNADQLAYMVNNLLKQQDSQRRQAEKPGGMTGPVAVIPDPIGNGLIVSANDVDFQTIGSIIAAVTHTEPGEPVTIKAYPLQTVTADRAARSLEDMIDMGDNPRRGRQAQRMRNMLVQLAQGEGQPVSAVIDPAKIHITQSPSNDALYISAPRESFDLIDKFVSLIDQSPTTELAATRRFEIQHGDASQISRTLQDVYEAQRRIAQSQTGNAARFTMPAFTPDDRTGSLFVTATVRQLDDIAGLVSQLDAPMAKDIAPLTMIELTSATPSRLKTMIDAIVIGKDPGKKDRVVVVPDDTARVLLVRADKDDLDQIQSIVREVDRSETKSLPIRTIQLQRADAAAAAQTLQKFFEDRALLSQRPNEPRPRRRISIIGDRRSGTLFIAANDDDFKDVQEVVKLFDAPNKSQDLKFEVVPLKYARAQDAANILSNMGWDLTYSESVGPYGGRSDERGKISAQPDTRTNSLVLSGSGENFQVIENVIRMLDVPAQSAMKRDVRIIHIVNGDVNLINEAVKQAYDVQSNNNNNVFYWYNQPSRPDELRIIADPANKLLIASGVDQDLQGVEDFVRKLDDAAKRPDQQIEILALQFADPAQTATMLSRFFTDRAKAANLPDPGITLTPARSSNKIIASATRDQILTIRDLLKSIDIPTEGDNRRIRLVVLDHGQAPDAATTLRQLFPNQNDSPDKRILVTSDARTNSLVISAPEDRFAEIQSVIDMVDAPPAGRLKLIQTFALTNSRAAEVADMLTETLDLSSPRTGRRGELQNEVSKFTDADGKPIQVEAKITPNQRNNSIIVVATPESMPLISKLVGELDQAPARSVREYRIYPLTNITASDIRYTLSSLVSSRTYGTPGHQDPAPTISTSPRDNSLIVAATAEQHAEIQSILKQLDVPSKTTRKTEFVPLKFAQAEKVAEALGMFYGRYAPEATTPGAQSVSIVPDPASNSLVISADQEEWAGLNELISKLDGKEYDTSLQLEVISLKYADAASVSQAINQAFAPEVQGNGAVNTSRGPSPRNNGGANNGEGNQQNPPRILVNQNEIVRAAAEPLTNSIIVSASQKNMEKIHSIITSLDVADFAKLPPAKLILLKDAKASEVAKSLVAIYAESQQQQSGRRTQGRKSVIIVPDIPSNTIIVRAEDEEFTQIEALAKALEQTSQHEGITVRVLPLKKADAGRVAQALRQTFATAAKEMDEPLAVEVDATSNSLVVASSQRLFTQVQDVVNQLDELGPGGGQQILIVPVENVSPAEMKRLLEQLDLDKPKQSGAGLLTEPIKAVPITGRKALAIVCNPADHDRILAVIASLDAQPAALAAQVQLVELKQAKAEAVVKILTDLLKPADQQSDSKLADAVKEQIHRLNIHRDSAKDGDLQLDLTQPIRVFAAPTLNGVIISSTKENCETLAEMAREFDQLPITEAVTVRLLPLSNMSADMMRNIAQELFTQGRKLTTQIGSNLPGASSSAVGDALQQDVAMTVDERTNTLIVAGREASVALVEVLVNKLDSDTAAKWVEPKIVQLRYADAADIAGTLNSVLVQGQSAGADAQALQKQVGRLRITKRGGTREEMIQGDMFVPMTRLIIQPDENTNSLIVVGTPENIDVVSELVAMLDTPAASPSNAVRIYTLDHATASRVAQIVTNLFNEQVASKAIRPEDKVITSADDRTNSLIVTTSTRSFAVLETLLHSLDSARAAQLSDIRMIRLNNASAAVVAPLIQRMMDSRLDRLRKVEPQTADLEAATIIADQRTNSLLVTAGKESYEVIRQLALSLENSNPSTANNVKIIPLTKGSAAKVQSIVQQVMDRQYADVPAEVARGEKPLILTDSRTNSLLITANNDDLHRITKLVDSLQNAPFNPALALQVIPVTGNRAETLAPRLSQLMREREQSLGDAAGALDRTVIQADPATNSLIVAASDENIQIIKGLIATLSDSEALATKGVGIEIVPLKNSRADRMVEQLNALHVNEVNRTRGQGTVQLTPDMRLNAVVIRAPHEEVATIRGLISELENTQITDVREIQVIPLKAANSVELVSLLDNVLAAGRATNDQQTTIIRLIRDSVKQNLTRGATGSVVMEENASDTPDADSGENSTSPADGSVPPSAPGTTPPLEPTETEISLAIREAIRLTPDLRTNSVVVSAPASSMRMIKELIDELDSAETGSKRVKIFQLVNADADQMAQLLSELFNLRQQGTLYVLRPRDMGDGAPAAGTGNTNGGAAAPGAGQPSGASAPTGAISSAPLGQTDLVTVPDERQQLSMTVDARTNSLIVSGTPSYIDLVGKVIEDLDSKTGTSRQELVYPLRNAKAKDVATALNTFLTQEQDRVLRTLGPDRAGSMLQQLEHQVSVVGVDQSNSLMISASPRYMDQIKGMIEELDKTPPQVLISVMLAEVTINSDDQWGMDMSVGPRGANLFKASSSFGLSAAGLSGLGVPNFSVSTDDFELLIRALQAQGRLEVLSKPQILVNNNVQAEFQVGQNIGYVDNVQFTESGSTQSSVTRKDIGIILDVLPSISPDRFVRMEVKPEISSLSVQTLQVSENFNTPIIDTRKVNTVVTVKDGQTVVIGGLLSNRTQTSDQKVPILGDIPILGIPFRTKLEHREKTELLVVITPHVVTSIDDARKYTDDAIKDMTIPDATKEQLRNGRTVPMQWKEWNNAESKPASPAVKEEGKPDDPAH